MNLLRPPLQARGPLLNLYRPTAGSGCVLWLPGQDDPQSATIRDRSGNKNNGAITGATWVRLPSGLWVLDFDGSDDKVTALDSNSLTLATGFTASCWVNTDDATGFHILHKGTYNTDGEYRFELDTDDKLYCYIFDESVASCFIGRGTAAQTAYEGTWVRYTLTYGGGTTSASCKLYRNGVQVDTGNNEASAASFVAMENLTGDLIIGNYGTNWANGKMALWKLENVVKTATQLLAEYKQERSLFGV